MKGKNTYIEEIITAAFVRLIGEKSVFQIKVTELARGAHISRNTFYLHYDSVQDLLEQTEAEFISGLWNVYRQFDRMTGSIEKLQSDDYFLQVFYYVREHREIYQALSGPNGDPSFNDRICDSFAEIFMKGVKQAGIGNMSEANLRVLYGSLASGRIYMYKWMVSHEDEVSLDEYARLSRKIADVVQSTLIK